MAQLPFKILRFLAFTRKRIFTDTVSWILIYVITFGLCTIDLWSDIESNKTSIRDILSDSLIYTLIMMFPVYINLAVFKKYILDQKIILRFWNYTFYLLAVIFNALIFALLLLYMYKYIDLLHAEFRFIFNVLTVFAIQLVSTGMLYRREVLIREKEWRRLEQKEEKRQALVADLQEKLEEVQISASKNHIKVGTKNQYYIIKLDNILYLQGDGNEPLIFTDDEKKKYYGTSRLVDYENILPSDKFIRVHRSFIIAKEKVVARKGKLFMLDGTEAEIPIGKTYEEEIANDEFLGFLT